jgi:GYF domain 2
MAELPKTGADAWYLLHEGQRHGPFPISAFLKAVEEGTITKDHLIWRPGWADWRSGRAAAELLGGPPIVDPPKELTDAERANPAALGRKLRATADGLTPPPAPIAEPAGFDGRDQFQRTRHSSAGASDELSLDEPHEWSDDLKKFLRDDLKLNSDNIELYDQPVTQETSALPSRNYFVRHWLGELSLPKAYWVNMVLAVIAICFSAFALQAALQNSGVQRGPVALSAWILFGFLVLVIVAWQLVGTWRSAAQHQERGGSVFWARAAQAMVVMGASAAVIAGVVDSSRFASSSTLADAATTEKVRDALARIPVYATLRRLDPAAFDSITGQVAEASPPGAGEDVIFAEARSVLGHTVKQYTPRASEDAILDMTDVMVAYMNALQVSDPESCVAINDQSTGARLRANLSKQFPAIFDRELAVNERILATGAGNTQPVPAEPQIKPQLNTVQTQLTQRFDRQLGLLSKKNLAPSEYATYCQIARALLEEIRRLPPKQAADLLRYVYAQS